MYFLRTPRHFSQNTGGASTSCPCSKAGQDWRKVHFPKPKSVRMSWNKGNGSFTRISFSYFLSIKKGKVTLCLSVTDFSPMEKLIISQDRTHDTESAANCKLAASAIWQATHSGFNEQNQFRHETQCYLAVPSRSLCSKGEAIF